MSASSWSKGNQNRMPAQRTASIAKSHASCQHHMPAMEAAVDARRGAPLPPPHQPHTDTKTCAAASGTIPLRLCKGPCLGSSWKWGAQRPKLDRCLCGRSCHRWRNQACAAFPRATPVARCADRSGRVLPCGPALHRAPVSMMLA